MDTFIEVLVSIVSGAFAGGITAHVYSVKNKRVQKTKGENSPNIGGDATSNHFGNK